MQTKQLHYIIEIARQQSLSGAAKVLGISQPALSQFIAAEEKSLGVSLFFSYRNRLYPTPAGTICIKAAAEMIRIKEQTYRKIRSCRADSRKRVRIGVSDFAAERMAAKAVPAVFGRYPDASVVPVVGTDSWLADQLRQGNLDMAVLGTGSPQVSGGSFYHFRFPFHSKSRAPSAPGRSCPKNSFYKKSDANESLFFRSTTCHKRSALRRRKRCSALRRYSCTAHSDRARSSRFQ